MKTLLSPLFLLPNASAVSTPPSIACGGEGVLIGCNEATAPIAAPSSAMFGGLIGNTVSMLITIFAIVAVFFVVKGGLTLVFSLGNEERLKSGFRTIVYALIGLVVAILAYTIVSIISSIRLF